MIQPPADFVALFQMVLVAVVTSTIVPLVVIFGMSFGLIMLSWIFKPFASVAERLKRVSL